MLIKYKAHQCGICTNYSLWLNYLQAVQARTEIMALEVGRRVAYTPSNYHCSINEVALFQKPLRLRHRQSPEVTKSKCKILLLYKLDKNNLTIYEIRRRN